MSSLCLCLGNTVFLIMGGFTLLVFIWMARGCPEVDYENEYVSIHLRGSEKDE